jgi:hypothetical protein
MSLSEKRSYLEAIRRRYRQASRSKKSKNLAATPARTIDQHG